MTKDIRATDSFWLPLFVVVMGAFAAILNNSSVNIAIPKMMAIFGVDTDQIQWVLTAYMLASGVIIPVTGYLGDAYGTKKLYLASLVVFTAGSLLCGIAWNNSTLIVARIIQGLGGGAIMPVSMTILYKIVPLKKIGTALGVWGMAAVVAPAIGPTLGGYIIEHMNWRFLFIMNVPVGLAALLCGALLLSESDIKKGLTFDFWGFVTSTLGCLTLLLALSQGQKQGWDSFYIVSMLVVSFFMLLLFVLIELNTPQPMLDLRLLKNSVFTVSVAGSSILTVGLFGGVFLIPIFTQNLMGKSAMDTGLILLPSAIVTMIMMPLSGALFDRMGAKLITFVGLVLLTLGTWEFRHLSADSSVLYIMLVNSLRSLGIGLAMMPMSTAGMNAIQRELVGRASALSNVSRQIAGAFGVAVFTAIMQTRQSFHYARLADSVTADAPALSLFAKQLEGLGLDQGSALSVLSGLAAKSAMVTAIDDTFIIAAVVSALAIPSAFFLGKGKSSATTPKPVVKS